MRHNSVDLVVFDMAGTTIQDTGQVVEAFSSALQEIGITPAEGALREWRGASKRAVLQFFVEQQLGPNHPETDARVERAYASFRQRLETDYATAGTAAIPGVEETFRWLRERGIRITLTTGFYRKVAEIVLEAVGWSADSIDATICSDEVPQGRPAPYMIFRAMEATGVTDVRRVIKVGDTARDLLAGGNAGVGGIIGVLSGSQTIEQLGVVKHTHIIPSAADLPALMRETNEIGK